MLTPSLLAHPKRVLSDWNERAYDHCEQKRALDPRDPNRDPSPFPGKPVPTSDGEAW